MAKRFSRTPHTESRKHLPPFAAYQAFPGSDYYGGSVAIGLASRRQSKCSPIANVIARLRRLVRSLEWGHSPPSACREFPATPSQWPVNRQLRVIGVISEGRRLSSLRTEVQAIQLSPYRAGLAEHRPKHPRPASAFPTCYCPLWLSPPSKWADPEVSSRASLTLSED